MVGLTTIAYLIVYAAHSIDGAYVVGNHGGSHWTKVWAPDGVITTYRSRSGRQRYEYTWYGMLFLVPTTIDQFLWHRDQDPEIGT